MRKPHFSHVGKSGRATGALSSLYKGVVDVSVFVAHCRLWRYRGIGGR
jgi:hypothetical protein